LCLLDRQDARLAGQPCAAPHVLHLKDSMRSWLTRRRLLKQRYRRSAEQGVHTITLRHRAVCVALSIVIELLRCVIELLIVVVVGVGPVSLAVTKGPAKLCSAVSETGFTSGRAPTCATRDESRRISRLVSPAATSSTDGADDPTGVDGSCSWRWNLGGRQCLVLKSGRSSCRCGSQHHAPPEDVWTTISKRFSRAVA
jgi:hypothetical protein